MATVPYSVELEQAFDDSFEKDPTSSSWGFFAYDDTPGAAGGGAGNFSWFDSKDKVVAFLQKFPVLAHSASITDEALLARAKDCLTKVKVENFDQKVIDELNQINKGIEQIQWFGPIEDLLSGDSEFASGLRKFYSGKTDAIAKTRIPEFGEFLRNWGH